MKGWVDLLAPHRLSLMLPPIATTRSLSLALDVLWSEVMALSTPLQNEPVIHRILGWVSKTRSRGSFKPANKIELGSNLNVQQASVGTSMLKTIQSTMPFIFDPNALLIPFQAALTVGTRKCNILIECQF